MKQGLRAIWLVIGLSALAAGLVGLFLPIVPTVPFLLLAAFSFARSSKRLQRWMLAHPVFGPPIDDWVKRGAVNRRAKWVASLSMAASVILAIALGLAGAVILAQATVMVAVAVFLWTRPES